MNLWWSLNRPVSASVKSRYLRPHPALGQLSDHGGVAFSGDQRFEHRPPGDASDVGGY